MQAQQRVFELQYLIDGDLELSRLCDGDCPFRLSLVEEHIYLMQEAAREKARKSLDGKPEQQSFSSLGMVACLDADTYTTTSFGDRKSALECKS